MRFCIFYFSGTGNTEYVARLLQTQFISNSYTCELVPMEELTMGKQAFPVHTYDLVGIGFPVHAMDAPRIVYRFIDLLPKTVQAYFLFKTAGSRFLLGGSTYDIRLKLAEKHWKLRHESFFLMPSNVFTSAKSTKIVTLAHKAAEQAQDCVKEICTGTRKALPSTNLMRIANRFNRFENEGCKHGSANWWADDNCINCGLCASQCPTGNISMMNGKPHFDKECIFCLRCRWNCPAKAIHHRQLEKFFLKYPYNLPAGK